MSNKKKKSLLPKLILAIVILLAAALGIGLLAVENRTPEAAETLTATESLAAEETIPAVTGIWLNDSLCITDAGDYTGIYMEDGSDEPVTGVLKIHLTNVSEKPVQYARIVMDVDGEEAVFTVTALPAGATVVVLEQNRMAYREDVDYMKLHASCEDLALFNGELSLQEDKLQIQSLKGALNITNISGQDIPETIILCYKGWQGDLYYGGIAYRIRLEGGLKAGELRQIMAQHYMDPGSKLVFVEFAG